MSTKQSWKYADNLKIGDQIVVYHANGSKEPTTVQTINRKHSGIHLDVIINGWLCYWSDCRIEIVQPEVQP